MGLLYKIAVVEGPLVPEKSDILVRTIISLLGEDAVEVTLRWLEQQRLADVQLHFRTICLLTKTMNSILESSFQMWIESTY